LILEAFAENSVIFQATDSRQYPGEFNCPVQMIPYVKLSMVASCQRTDPTSGMCELALGGQYYGGSFGAQDNTLKVECQINSEKPVQLEPEFTDTGYQLTATLTGLDYTKSHRVTVTVLDKLMAVTQTMTVKKGIPVFDWGQNDFAFHVPVHANAGLQVAGKALWEHIYPVGAVYISANETDPGELFGGAWEQLKDRFLLAAGDVYGAGSRGGEAEHTLTVDEIPSHGHNVPVYWKGASGNSSVNVQGMESSDPRQYTSWINNTDAAGGGEPHNNMPPYLAVYMWKRIA
jgi:hypothetical protein